MDYAADGSDSAEHVADVLYVGSHYGVGQHRGDKVDG